MHKKNWTFVFVLVFVLIFVVSTLILSYKPPSLCATLVIRLENRQRSYEIQIYDNASIMCVYSTLNTHSIREKPISIIRRVYIKKLPQQTYSELIKDITDLMENPPGSFFQNSLSDNRDLWEIILGYNGKWTRSPYHEYQSKELESVVSEIVALLPRKVLNI